jgi:hypothetical protein
MGTGLRKNANAGGPVMLAMPLGKLDIIKQEKYIGMENLGKIAQPRKKIGLMTSNHLKIQRFFPH